MSLSCTVTEIVTEIRVLQEEHERVSKTGVFPSLDRVSGTFYLLHYVTETSHLYSLRDFWRHFDLSRAATHSGCCFFGPCTNILTYLLTARLVENRPTCIRWPRLGNLVGILLKSLASQK